MTVEGQCPLWVRNGHSSTDVRFTPKSGHWLSMSRCLLCAKSGHEDTFTQYPLFFPKGGMARRRLFLSSRLENQGCDRVRLRNQGEVACLYLDRFRAHALCHESFQIGIDRSIFRRNRIEARL